MWIIGCDFHPSFEVVAIFDTDTKQVGVRRLQHRAEAERFYRQEVPAGSVVGVETCGFTQWFEKLLQEAGIQMWMGDATRIRASVVRAQKTDRRDAEHILQLMLERRFPQVWMASPEERDLRQLLMHRHKLVRVRTQVKNQLQALALNQGMQKKGRLWTKQGRAQLEALPLLPYADRRRRELLEMVDRMDAQIEELDQIGKVEAEKRAEVRYLMQQPGVGWQTALAMVLTIGDVGRFPRAKQVASYVGLIPRENSSGGKQRFGHISKQGNSFMRFLLVEAGQAAVRYDEELKQDYRRWSMRCGRPKAKVAVARKLAVKMYWMLREHRQAAQR